MPPIGHSKLGASSAARWLMCPGSVALSEGMPDKSSKYAIEGTAAHQLAEDCLRGDRSPWEYVNGGSVTIEDEDGEQVEYPVSADMAGAVIVYTQMVQALQVKFGRRADTEVKFHLNWIDEQLFGTNDVSIGIPFDVLNVHDYKHGVGLVEVEYPETKVYASGGQSKYNPQLMYYAVGAVGEGNLNCYTGINLGVVQPRAHHSGGKIREASVSIEELNNWVETVLIPGVALTRQKNAPLCAGAHCKYCKALSVCPKACGMVASVARLSAKEAFGAESAPVSLPDPKTLTDVERVLVYEFAGLVSDWVKAVQADAHEQLKSGHDLPGLKLVQGRASTKWVDTEAAGAEIKEALKSSGTEEFYNPPKLRTPKQVEKALADKGLDKKMFESLTVTSRGTTVALETDKRERVKLETAADAFKNNK